MVFEQILYSPANRQGKKSGNEIGLNKTVQPDYAIPDHFDSGSSDCSVALRSVIDNFIEACICSLQCAGFGTSVCEVASQRNSVALY